MGALRTEGDVPQKKCSPNFFSTGYQVKDKNLKLGTVKIFVAQFPFYPQQRKLAPSILTAKKFCD